MQEKLRLPDGFKVYWINLDSSVGRRERMLKRLEEAGWSDIARRIEAVDETQVDNLVADENWEQRKKNVNKRAAACTLSHLKAIQQASIDDCDYAIILEDDVTFEFVQYWNCKLTDLLNSIPAGYRVSMLSWFCTSQRKINQLNFQNEKKMFWMNYQLGIYGTFAYTVSRKGIASIFMQRICPTRNRFYILTNQRWPKCESDWVLTEGSDVYVCTVPLFGYEATDSTIHINALPAHIKHLRWMRNRLQSTPINWPL